MGHRPNDVSALSGYSLDRVSSLHQDPAFQELIAQKRQAIDKAFDEGGDEYGRLLISNRIKAERQLADKLDEAEENDETLPTRELLAIGRDAADRTGYGKTNVQFNINSDFATMLDRAVKESNKVIEGTVTKVIASAPQHVDAPTLVAVSSLRRV